MIKFKKINLNSRICFSDLVEYEKCVNDLIFHPSVQIMKQFNHHSFVTCFDHSIHVSLYSYLICKYLKLDYRSAARGGLLHDLFLYDWRTTKLDSGKHGFQHPKIALNNAGKFFKLNYVEKDIIIKHMFPLTIKPPIYKESIVVCLIDKLCATLEVMGGCPKLDINNDFKALKGTVTEVSPGFASIAATISEISNQTKLLDLNESIEDV